MQTNMETKQIRFFPSFLQKRRKLEKGVLQLQIITFKDICVRKAYFRGRASRSLEVLEKKRVLVEETESHVFVRAFLGLFLLLVFLLLSRSSSCRSSTLSRSGSASGRHSGIRPAARTSSTVSPPELGNSTLISSFLDATPTESRIFLIF